MSIINSINSYIREEEFKVVILKNRVNVVNFKELGLIDTNKIIIKNDNQQLIIRGNDLVISKLLSDEILILGNVETLEFR